MRQTLNVGAGHCQLVTHCTEELALRKHIGGTATALRIYYLILALAGGGWVATTHQVDDYGEWRTNSYMSCKDILKWFYVQDKCPKTDVL